MVTARWCFVAIFGGAVSLLAVSQAARGDEPSNSSGSKVDVHETKPTRVPWSSEPNNDAIRLFDGSRNHLFLSKTGQKIDWPIKEGALISTRDKNRSNHILSRLHFRDADIHVEFQLPQSGSGNSGVYIHGHYELQIIAPGESAGLDAMTLGAVYGISKPLFKAKIDRSEWHFYDIRYLAPRRHEKGRISEAGRISAWLNGKLIQADAEFEEPVSVYHPYRHNTTSYLKTIERNLLRTGTGPLFLQDHDNPVEFRNVWVRPLDDMAFQYEAD
jgi:hypothetical protein